MDQRRALPELADELRDVISHRDGFRQSFLFGTRFGDLCLQGGGVRVALRQLGRDLGSDLREHRLKHALAQHVLLQMVDQGAFDLGHRLMHLDGANGVATFVMLRAAVAEHAFACAAVCLDPCGCDGAVAGATSSNPGECVLGRRPATSRIRLARRELRVHGEPSRIIDNAPLGDLDDDDVARISLHARDSAGLTNLLDPPVHVNAAIARVQKDRAHSAGCPRATPTPARRGCGYAVVIECMSDLLVAAPRQILAKHAFDDRGFGVIYDGDRETAPGVVALALELVAVACTACDPSFADATAQRFARSRANRLELHLVASALDEGRCLIDRIRELNFHTARVIEQPATAIANEVANHERDFYCVAAETRLIATHDHVATLCVSEQLAEARTTEEIIARATIVDVVDHRLLGEAHPSQVLGAAFLLHIEAKLLLAFVVLGAASIRADGHRVLGSECDGSRSLTGVVGSRRRHRVSQCGADEHTREGPVQENAITVRMEHDDRRS